MSKTEDAVSNYKRRIPIDVNIELRIRKVDAQTTRAIITASKGVFSAIHSVDRKLPAEMMEDAVATIGAAEAEACRMLEDILSRTAKDLGIDIADVQKLRSFGAEPSTTDLAGWAGEMMELYQRRHYGGREPAFTVISDFLCNLRHHADLRKLDWQRLLDRAEFHYDAEVEERNLPVEKQNARAVGKAIRKAVGIPKPKASRKGRRHGTR